MLFTTWSVFLSLSYLSHSTWHLIYFTSQLFQILQLLYPSLVLSLGLLHYHSLVHSISVSTSCLGHCATYRATTNYLLFFLLKILKYSKIYYHKIYYLSYFKVYSSIVLNILTWLCSQSPELFYLAKMKLCIH